MSHLPAQHIVGCRNIATEINSIYVGSIAGLDKECHVDGLIFLVHLRHAGGLGECVAQISQELHHDLLGAGYQALGVNLPGPDEYSRAQQGFRIDQVSRQIHFIDDVQGSLVDVHRDINFFLVWRNSDGSGIDIELHVAVIEIERFKSFQVTGELFPRIPVLPAHEQPPGLGSQFEQSQQILFLESSIADNVNVTNSRFFSLVDSQADCHPVAGQLFNLNVYCGTVTASRRVDILYSLPDEFQGSAGKNLTLCDIGAGHIIDDVFGLEYAVAFDFDRSDRGSFQHRNDEDIAFPRYFDFVKILGTRKRTDNFRRCRRHHLITDAHR